MKKILLLLLIFSTVAGKAQTRDTVLHYSSGKKQAEGKWKKDQREGSWKAYYESGALRMKGNYVKGQPDRWWESYYENGAKHRVEYYQKGRIGGKDYRFSGNDYEYYENGNLKQVHNWVKGKLEGVQKQFYPSGVLKKEAICVKGLFHGPMKEYYENKNLRAETVYIHGKATTPSSIYYPDGKIKEVGPMPDGSYVLYDTLGNKILHRPRSRIEMDDKPVIYLYPEKEQEVQVTLDYKGKFLFTYPEYRKGWKVKAWPDGKLINAEDQKEYSYLFWEGEAEPNGLQQINTSEGFVVKGEETQAFLQKTFAGLGLLPKEYNELLVFWLPKMIHHPYNYIHFLVDGDYDGVAGIQVDPSPDAMRRVFMVFQGLKEKIEVRPQEFPAFERKGFTVVEWGGRETTSLIKVF